MRRSLGVATVMTIVLAGTIVPAHATVMPMSILITATDPTSAPKMLDGILDATLAARATTEVAFGLTDSHAPRSLASGPSAFSTDDEAFPALLSVAAEPSTLLLVGTGVAGLAGMVRRRLIRRR